MGDIGQRIRTSRKRRGLTGAQLAQLLGTAQSKISDWERDSPIPKLKTLERIAEALQVNPQWLVTGEGEVEVQRVGQPLSQSRDLELRSLNSKEVGSRIKEARMGYPNITLGVEPTGISQADLANKIGVDGSLISKWEAGERAPSKEQIKPLADALGVKLKWLAFGEGDKDRFPVPESDQVRHEHGDLIRFYVSNRFFPRGTGLNWRYETLRGLYGLSPEDARLVIGIEEGKEYLESAMKVARHRERQDIEDSTKGQEGFTRQIREMYPSAGVIRIPTDFPPYWPLDIVTFFKENNLAGRTWWIPLPKNHVTFSSLKEPSHPQPTL